MVTVRNGVNVRGVDQPYRTGAPARMTFQDWNTSKENVNETYGSYTANLGTLARVMDITKQYARFSAGAAEADVIDELTRAAVLGENYYMIGGLGTGSVGSGDPTTGVYTALLASGVAAYKTAFTPSGTTLAGSAASGFAQAIGALAARSREASGIVVDSVTYWTIVAQGTDTAGFWTEPEIGPTGFTRTSSGAISFWGVPIYWDANLTTESTSKIALIAQWDVLKLYRGMEFRIDTSDTAGTRFDYNLIGFRGEEEIGFDARTALGVGALQLVTGIIA
jgi:HK97 family phage major capsid protein